MGLIPEDKYRYLGLGDPSNVELQGDQFALSNYNVTQSNRTDKPLSESISATVDVENLSTSDTYDTNIFLRINGNKQDTVSVELNSGGTTTVELNGNLLPIGVYDVVIDSPNSSDSYSETIVL